MLSDRFVLELEKCLRDYSLLILIFSEVGKFVGEVVIFVELRDKIKNIHDYSFHKIKFNKSKYG